MQKVAKINYKIALMQFGISQRELVRALRIAKLNDIEVNEDAINLSLSQLLWSK